MKLGVALRQLGTANAGSAKSIEKLSSGYRINRAGDDAAGLAISEKMRGQIRGLNQASANSQDGISMVQTAEGALSETHAILQRMRELAVQSGNDTNVGVDRGEIQKEMDQLTTEINRIGNTTEFNTQSVLKGDGSSSLDKTGLVSKGNLASGDTTHVNAEQALKVGTAATGDLKTTSNAIAAAFEKVIAANEKLAGNYTSVADGIDLATITAVGDFEGKAGNIGAASKTGTAAFTGAADSLGTTTHVKASTEIDLSGVADATKLIGQGMTINGQKIEFYNANDGSYKGENIGVNILDS